MEAIILSGYSLCGAVVLSTARKSLPPSAPHLAYNTHLTGLTEARRVCSTAHVIRNSGHGGEGGQVAVAG